jgi:chromosome segregation ATPase
VQSQDRKISQQDAQIQGLRTAIAQIGTIHARMNDFEEMVANFKAEIVFQMDEREQARRKELVESERLRRIEYEALTDHLHRLDRRLQALPRYDEQLNALNAEGQRLSEGYQVLSVQITDLSRRVEEEVKGIPYLEEQRRVDHHRIVDLERDVPQIVRRIDAVGARLPLIEDNIRKLGPRIDQAMVETKKYEKPIEELRASDFQREQKMKQYLGQGEAVNIELERVREQTIGFVEQQQEVKRYLKRLDSFQARHEKRQNEVTEMQRVAEERLRRQWDEWREEQAKFLRKGDVVARERWQRQDKTNDELEKRIRVFPPVLELHQQQLEALWDIRRDDATQILKAAQDVYDGILAPIDEQVAVLRGEPVAKRRMPPE